MILYILAKGIEYLSIRLGSVSYTHLRAHETGAYLVCRLLLEKKRRKVCRYEKKSYLCNRNRETNNVSRDAQMAESVDAQVSNTSGFTSIPVRPRVWVQERKLSN